MATSGRSTWDGSPHSPRGWDDEDSATRMTTSSNRPSLPAWRSCRHRSGPWPTSCGSMASCSKWLQPPAPANPPPRPPGRRWRGGSRRSPPPIRTLTWCRFLAEEGDLLLRAELAKRFREATAPRGKGRALGAGRRTVAQLLAACAALAKEKSRTAGRASGPGAGEPRARTGGGADQASGPVGPPRAGRLARSRTVDRHEASQGLRPGGHPAGRPPRSCRSVRPDRRGSEEDP